MALFPVNLNFRKRDFGRCLFTIAETGLNTLEISQLACDRETDIHTATALSLAVFGVDNC